MSTPVVMPQMGESIAEGTIVRWIKKVGDSVDRDEPLFEISTDKVDAEIPSPAAGTLLEITVKEGETVPVNSVVAKIGAAGDATAAAAPAEPAPTGKAAKPEPQGDGTPAKTPSSPAPAPPTGAAVRDVNGGAAAEPSADELRRQKSSPLVRRIAKEHGVDIRQIAGSGIAGRVTKHDILDYIDKGGAPASAPDGATGGKPSAPSAPTAPVFHLPTDEVVPMSVMRKKIAEHMIVSRRTSAHVYSVFEVNYSRVDDIRSGPNTRRAASS
jgi:pyruvate dehydrogenase E2 component (dihydrolipoamide acetyltransferase)